MAPNRREFLRRFAAFSILGAAGMISVWELLQRQSALQQQSASSLTLPTTVAQSTQSSTQSSTQTGQSSASSSRSSTSSQSSTQQAPSGYILLAPLSALSGRTSAYFNHPNFGPSILLNFNGQWKAFNSACTHAGCTVQYASSSIYCPCHAGYFSPSNGSPTGGPPSTSLPEYDVKVVGSNLYVGTKVIN